MAYHNSRVDDCYFLFFRTASRCICRHKFACGYDNWKNVSTWFFKTTKRRTDGLCKENRIPRAKNGTCDRVCDFGLFADKSMSDVSYEKSLHVGVAYGKCICSNRWISSIVCVGAKRSDYRCDDWQRRMFDWLLGDMFDFAPCEKTCIFPTILTR